MVLDVLINITTNENNKWWNGKQASAVLDFQNPCLRPESPALYPRRKKDVRDDFRDGSERFEDPGRR